MVIISIACTCNLPEGSVNNICDANSGKCTCNHKDIVGMDCDKCRENHYGFPSCTGKIIMKLLIEQTLYSLIWQLAIVMRKVLLIFLVAKKDNVAVSLMLKG